MYVDCIKVAGSVDTVFSHGGFWPVKDLRKLADGPLLYERWREQAIFLVSCVSSL
jgi:hypothetical protein